MPQVSKSLLGQDDDATVPAIRLLGVEKRFGAFQALKPVTLDVPGGTVHAFVGQNGAGKSTTLGVIAGRIPASAGVVELHGEAVELGDPRKARRAGVFAIYQELTIVRALTASANVFLGQTYANFGFLAEKAMRERFGELSERLRVNIDPDRPAGELSVADQQSLEIMRALEADARIILFDEPTAALAPPEREALFVVMRDLKAHGHTLIYVSHNLDEVIDIADTVSVFRNGSLVETRPATDWNKSSLVHSMLGADLGDIYHRRPPATVSLEKPVLEASGITLPGAVTDLSFSVSRGEVLGIGGLVGSGRSSLLRCLAGLEPRSSGSMKLRGQSVRWPKTPAAARRYGIALVPEDRKEQGLVLGMRAADNVALPNLKPVSKWGFIDQGRLKSLSSQAASRFGLDARSIESLVGTLSGGNQQKVLLARWSYETPLVLLVDEPTRGIDVGAKAEILDALRGFADSGLAVVIVSSELEEIASLADRVLVLSEGLQVDEIHANRTPISVHTILNSAFGVERHHHG